MRVDRLFMEAELKLKGGKPTPAKFFREEISWFVSDWFVKEEARSEEWRNRELPVLSEEERGNVLDGLKAESGALGIDPQYDGSLNLDQFLNGDG